MSRKLPSVLFGRLRDPGQPAKLHLFQFEQARGALRGPDGADLPLSPKALALLVHLLGNPGRFLRRDDLLDQLWPGVTVTEDSLTQCVSELAAQRPKRLLTRTADAFDIGQYLTGAA